MYVKDSFILYTEQKEVIDKLTDEQAGKLIKAIYEYVETDELPELDTLLDIVITPFKQNIDRNTSKWEEIKQKRSEAGKKGGAPKGNNNADKTNKNKQNKQNKQKQTKQAKQAVNVNGNVNVNVNVNDNVNNNIDVALDNFYEMRKKIKKPLTENGKQLIIEKLNTLSKNEEEQIQILNNSIMNCWQGIFPLKEDFKLRSRDIDKEIEHLKQLIKSEFNDKHEYWEHSVDDGDYQGAMKLMRKKLKELEDEKKRV